jgi:hypothetical protein
VGLALGSRGVLGPPPPPTPQEIARSSLRDAFLRVDRAGEHLACLQRRVEAFTEAQNDKPIVELHGGIPVIVGEPEHPPRMFSVLVGETIQNLRTALDYLVYALAWLDSGVHHDMTQFPIESAPEGFDGRRATYLKGLSDEHVAAIERLQPFKGGAWLGTLANASNQDKHWALNVTLAAGYGTITFGPPIGGAGEGSASPSEVNVHHEHTVYVALHDGTPILEPLKAFESSVRGVLDSFKADFEG